MIAAEGQQGFTLIEAMVALSILAIASVGIIQAAEAHVDTLRRLEQRAAAQLVAENALVEAELGSGASAATSREVAMLDWRWSVDVQLKGSEDRDVQQAIVTVRQAGSRDTLVSLNGFVDRGTITP